MKRENHRSFVLHKPFGVLCQFTDENGRKTLADLASFPSDVYSAGRLDADSEGLLLLTNDGKLKHALLDPASRHPRTYLAQVERIPSEDALDQLRTGVIIEGRKTHPATVELLAEEPGLPARPVPIRFRKNVPTAWLRITLTEGRNRQVRKMTAAVGHPTLRLVRISFGILELGNLRPGEVRELTPEEVTRLHASVTAAGSSPA